MSQYMTLFVAARGTQKENSATKPVVISKSSCNSSAWQSEWGFTLTALQSTVLRAKYMTAKRISRREGKNSVGLNKNKQSKLLKQFRWLTGRLETAIHDLHVYIIGVKWRELEYDHKPLYNVETTSEAIILSLYMSVLCI